MQRLQRSKKSARLPPNERRGRFAKISHSKYENNDVTTPQKWRQFFREFDEELKKKAEFCPGLSKEWKKPQPVDASQNLTSNSTDTIIFDDEPLEIKDIPPDHYFGFLKSGTNLKNLESRSILTTRRKSDRTTKRQIQFEGSDEVPSLSAPTNTLSTAQYIQKLKQEIFNFEEDAMKSQDDLLKFIASEELILREDAAEDDMVVEVDKDDLINRTKLKRTWSKRMPFLDPQEQYLRFLMSTEKVAAKWRPQEEKKVEDLHSMPLSQQAAFVEDMVATGFCRWLDELGGVKINIDEEILKEMFQIGLINPTSYSIRGSIMETVTIPEGLAKIKNLEKRSIKQLLRNHAAYDNYAAELNIPQKAFGKNVPSNKRFIHTGDLEDWAECKTIPKDLIDFKVAFGNILHLQCVNKFCLYLIINKTFVRPRYLREHGLFDMKNLKRIRAFGNRLKELRRDEAKGHADDFISLKRKSFKNN